MSFKLEYTAPGYIKAASLTSPEAQVLTAPKVMNLLNGIVSLVDLGLNHCYSGFGPKTTGCCECLGNGMPVFDFEENNYGRFAYTPSDPSKPFAIVNELSLLLTGGRLNSSSKSVIVDAFKGESNSADGLKLAQKLLLTTP